MLKRTKRTLERLAVGTVLAGALVVWPYRHKYFENPPHLPVLGITHTEPTKVPELYKNAVLLWPLAGIGFSLILAWAYDHAKKRHTSPGEALQNKRKFSLLCGTLAGFFAEQYFEHYAAPILTPEKSIKIILAGTILNYFFSALLDQGEGSILRGIKNMTSGITGRTTHTAYSYVSKQKNTIREALHQRNLGNIEEALALERKAFSDLNQVIETTTLDQEILFPLSFFLGTLIKLPASKEQVYFWRAKLLARFGWFYFSEKYIETAISTSKHPYIAVTIAEWYSSLEEQEETLKQWWPGPYKRFSREKNLAQRAKTAWIEAVKRLEKSVELQQVSTLSTAEKNILVIENPYLAESIVLASPRKPEDLPCIEWEEKTLCWYYPILSHLVPTPIGKIELNKQTYFAERRIGTTTLLQAISQGTLNDRQKKQTVDLLAQIHNHTPPFAFNPLEKNPEYLKKLLAKSLNNFLLYKPNAKESVQLILEELTPVYAELKRQPFALNKDTHPQNWTDLHETVRAIDFGCTCEGPRKGPVLNNLVRLIEGEGIPKENIEKQLQQYIHETNWQWDEEPIHYYSDSGVYDHLLCSGNRMKEYLATKNSEKLKNTKEHISKAVTHLKNTRLKNRIQCSLFFACTNIL